MSLAMNRSEKRFIYLNSQETVFKFSPLLFLIAVFVIVDAQSLKRPPEKRRTIVSVTSVTENTGQGFARVNFQESSKPYKIPCNNKNYEAIIHVLKEAAKNKSQVSLILTDANRDMIEMAEKTSNE